MIKGIVKTRIYVEIITNWPSRGTEFVFPLGGIPVVWHMRANISFAIK